MILMAVTFVAAFAGISSSVKAESHLSPTPEDQAIRNTYNKVWWTGFGTAGLAFAYQIFVASKIQSTQRRIVELKNEIAAAEVAEAESQNVAETDESTTDAGNATTSDETQSDSVLDALEAELAQEEAKLASYKKKSYVCLGIVLGGLAAELYANHKVTGNALVPWHELK